MREFKEEKRKLHALRKHIDELLANGAVIKQRDPLTLIDGGQVLLVNHGMLICHRKPLAMTEPAKDHERTNALREIAADVCRRQLDEALEAELGEKLDGSNWARQGQAR